jgi:threonine synthase
MRYGSTNNKAPLVDFREATINGQAPDRGLYFPEKIPVLQADFFEQIAKFSEEEIALEVMRPYTGDCLTENELRKIISATFSFPFPLVSVTDSIASLELFHGPSLAFKDVGARFMSECLGIFLKSEDRKITVLVATSGDTGGAVAHGFYGVDGIEVVILYPEGKVSEVQERQLTTLGKNITALSIEGSFDDCQRMVKEAFADEDLRSQRLLTSANSINVARWLPQQCYYFFAWKQWMDKANPPVIAVPSGNFGNICAGMLAYRTGLPVKKFIAATNANDTVPRYLVAGEYEPWPTISTLSNAMDVGDPSNFWRILQLFDSDPDLLKDVMQAVSISDGATKETIRKVYGDNNYLLDPHGAVAFNALSLYLEKHPEEKGYFLETAHPVKFYDVVEPLIGQQLIWPEGLEQLRYKKMEKISMKANGKDLKDFLLSA